MYIQRCNCKSAALQAALIERDLASGVEKELMRGNLGGVWLSPDGRYIATTTVDLSTMSKSMVLVPVAGGEPRVLMRAALSQSKIDRDINLRMNLKPLNALRFLWAPDSRSFVCQYDFHSEKPPGDFKPVLWWVPVDDREPPKRVSLNLTSKSIVGTLSDVRVHPDGRRIAIEMQEEQPRLPADVWVFENFLPATPTGKTSVSRR